MRTVRLTNTGDDIKLQISGRMISDESLVEVGYEFEEDVFPYSSLRDLSIIMNSLMGQGVTWHLGYEVSKRLNLNPLIVVNTLREIVKEYSMLSEEQVYKIEENEVPDGNFFNQILQ